MIGFNNKLLIHNTHVLDTYRTFAYMTETYFGYDVFYGVTNETDRTCGVLMPNGRYWGGVVTYPVQAEARHATSILLTDNAGGGSGAIYGHLSDFRRWNDTVSRVVPPTGVQYLRMYVGVFAVPQSGMTEITCTGDHARLREKLSVVEPTLVTNLVFDSMFGDYKPEPDFLRITASTSWIGILGPHTDSPYQTPMALNGPLVPPLSGLVIMPYIDQDGHRFYGTIEVDPDNYPAEPDFYAVGYPAVCFMTM